jgi:DNA helicase-2/ATP-dependent DNA helicase PcrA
MQTNKVNWSAEQEAIFEWFRSGTGALVVEAFAGTGKTTTIKEAFRHAPEAKILYAVFNKKNQVEAQEKITDTRVDVRTLHSLGFSYIKRNWPNAKPDDGVEQDRIREAMGSDNFEKNKDVAQMLAKLVAFAKNTTINPTLSDLRTLAQDMDLPVDAALALRVLELSKVEDREGRISFNDMVWLPVAMGWVTPRYTLVCVDEAQDMNLPQLTMAQQALKPGGRMVVVGDSRQAIYGFRGAVQDGMGMMRTKLRAQTLTLSTTYRCPRKVVEIARTIVPAYQAAPTAPEGEVCYTSESNILLEGKPGDAVLSRLNAPLMPLALSFLRKNIPARIEGRDIGKQLVGTIKSLRAKSVPHLIEKIATWAEKQKARIPSVSRNYEKKVETIHDTRDTLTAIAEGASSVADVEARILNLFQDTDKSSRPAVTLSSVHKAKGLEWDKVFVLSHTFRTKQGEDEEANIYYVAVTRAKKVLTFVGTSVPAPQTSAGTSEQVEPHPEDLVPCHRTAELLGFRYSSLA